MKLGGNFRPFPEPPIVMRSQLNAVHQVCATTLEWEGNEEKEKEHEEKKHEEKEQD